MERRAAFATAHGAEAAKLLDAAAAGEEQARYVAYVPLPDQKAIELRVLEKKKQVCARSLVACGCCGGSSVCAGRWVHMGYSVLYVRRCLQGFCKCLEYFTVPPSNPVFFNLILQ